jgi:hypothetical protein
MMSYLVQQRKYQRIHAHLGVERETAKNVHVMCAPDSGRLSVYCGHFIKQADGYRWVTSLE